MLPVSRTAQWTAAIRAEESRRADRLFSDEFAEVLAQPEGRQLLERYKGAGVRDYVAIRTAYIDHACRRLTDQQPDLRQIALIAAGMDARAFRLPWPQGTKIFELDHAELLSEKEQRLQRSGRIANAARYLIGVDLAGDWASALKRSAFVSNHSTLWIVEGLTFFLAQDELEALLDTLMRLSAPDSWLVVDMTSAALLRSPFSRSFLKRLQSDGSPWRFGTDAPAEFLGRHGWRVVDVKQPGEPGAGETRWTYQVPPRTSTKAPRSWLITARRGA